MIKSLISNQQIFKMDYSTSVFSVNLLFLIDSLREYVNTVLKTEKCESFQTKAVNWGIWKMYVIDSVAIEDKNHQPMSGVNVLATLRWCL